MKDKKDIEQLARDIYPLPNHPTGFAYKTGQVVEMERSAFIKGYELAQQSQSASIQQAVKTVPYQCCPICNGTGKILADGCVSSLYQQCKVCNGAMIIPQYVLPKVLEQLNVSDGWVSGEQKKAEDIWELISDEIDVEASCENKSFYRLKDSLHNIIKGWHPRLQQPKN